MVSAASSRLERLLLVADGSHLDVAVLALVLAQVSDVLDLTGCADGRAASGQLSDAAHLAPDERLVGTASCSDHNVAFIKSTEVHLFRFET